MDRNGQLITDYPEGDLTYFLNRTGEDQSIFMLAEAAEFLSMMASGPNDIYLNTAVDIVSWLMTCSDSLSAEHHNHQLSLAAASVAFHNHDDATAQEAYRLASNLVEIQNDDGSFSDPQIVGYDRFYTQTADIAQTLQRVRVFLLLKCANITLW